MMTITKPMTPMNRRNQTMPPTTPVMKPTHPTMPVTKPTKLMNTRDLTMANLRNVIRRRQVQRALVLSVVVDQLSLNQLK